MNTARYQQLIDEVQKLTLRLHTRYQAHLQCGAGCSGCCQHHLSVFPVEAQTLRTAIQNVPAGTQQLIRHQAIEISGREAADENVTCPLLINHHCAVYESRPLICRTQGLPLLYEAEDGNHEVDFCPLNFTTDDAISSLEDDHLVPLDALNLKLALANLEFCLANNLEPGQQRIKISEIVLEENK